MNFCINNKMIRKVLSSVDYSQLPDRYIVNRTPIKKKPHISYGIMLYSIPDDSWLLVRSKYSYAFNLFMSGMYRKSELELIVSNMTKNELTILKDLCLGSIKWNELYDGYFYSNSYERFLHVKSKLRSLLQQQTTLNEKTTWTFPKGRLENKENPFQCAVREFEEETGLNLYSLQPILQSQYAFSENYLSFDNEYYRTDCWFFTVNSHIPNLPPVEDDREISERIWMKTDEALKTLSTSKHEMITACLLFLNSHINVPKINN